MNGNVDESRTDVRPQIAPGWRHFYQTVLLPGPVECTRILTFLTLGPSGQVSSTVAIPMQNGGTSYLDEGEVK